MAKPNRRGACAAAHHASQPHQGFPDSAHYRSQGSLALAHGGRCGMGEVRLQPPLPTRLAPLLRRPLASPTWGA